ncbi:hypothetical protein OG455_01220 [Kitasatospora sp. NBC_01287]|uniref:hypothetical protein n=1 Tax=Kitasatospora sp. NBC_01287 TaxID=2903573 RepID=UPI0022511341|nr:hypothetical protein [Kitasatospora sp. NBC_01287]MCX4744145.1 hypothetical protein [Kitasatospora sp. NBC_01287]
MAEHPDFNRGQEQAHPAHDVVHEVAEIPTWAVVWMVGISMGLGLAAAQISTLWILILFSVFWGATVLAMLWWAARWVLHREGSGGWPRQPAY